MRPVQFASAQANLPVSGSAALVTEPSTASVAFDLPAALTDAMAPVQARFTSPARPCRVKWPGHGCAQDVGWIKKGAPPATDATVQFAELDAAAKAGQNVLPPDAKDYVYLMAGGLFTGALPHDVYLHQNLEALHSAGLEARRVPVSTDQSIEHNAVIIRDAVLEAAARGKKVVLIGHSQGGLDAYAALALYPELKDNIRALVTIQSPHGG